VVTPLSELGADLQEKVRVALLSDTPPPKYHSFGSPDDPRPIAQIISRVWYEWHLAHGNRPTSDGEIRTPPRREWQRLAPALRPVVLARDGRVCRQCGAEGSTTKLHIDHIVPLAKGGSSDPSNLQVLCQRCNLEKGAR
jgi:5-methylcytosine-specific restriction protein A